MENKYLASGTDVTVHGVRGITIGMSIFSSTTIKVQLLGTAITDNYPRADVELYVKPRVPKKLFKSYKEVTKEEQLMASLFQAVSHEDVVVTALDALTDEDRKLFTTIRSPKEASSKWTLLMPKDILPSAKIPILIAHTDLHPNLKHPTVDNLEYENDQFTCPTGLGADDRAGIFAITQLIPHMSYMPFAVLFPDEEEVGLKGSYAFIRSRSYTEIDKHASMYISIDRRRNKNGSASLATYGVNNDALNKKVGKLLSRDVIRGSSTDCRALAAASTHKVPCFNLSCGYDKEHTKDEILYFKELENTVLDLFTLFADDSIVGVAHPVDPVTTTYYSGNHSYNKESSVLIGASTFKKSNIQDLLAMYLYYTGRKYEATKTIENDVVPDILIGSTMRLNPMVVETQRIGGEILTAEMFTTLKTDLWEVENYDSDLKLELKGITTEISCTNIPLAWLEEVLPTEPQFES